MLNWRECKDAYGELQFTTDDINAEVYVYENQYIVDRNVQGDMDYLPWHFCIRWWCEGVNYDIYTEIGYKTKEEAIQFVETLVEKHVLKKE